MNQDRLFRVRARLIGLRQSLSGQPVTPVPETYVNEFHEALSHLEAIGIDVSEFKIPASQLRAGGRGKTAKMERHVAPFFFLARLDASLAYLELAAQVLEDSRRPLGFMAC